MMNPLKRIAILLVICVLFLFLIASPALAVSNSGKGMNRQGGPSTHPGKGWKDPGSWQGSPKNLADSDCTGNRTTSPQSTNIGDCDDSAGAADKPGGTGGFDSDKDWNNGCGNEIDFEDDNNGLCLGSQQPSLGGGAEVKAKVEGGKAVLNGPGPSPSVVLPSQVVRQPKEALPVTVLSGEIRRAAPTPAGQVPARTGLAAMDLLLIGISSIALGMRMLHRGRYLSR